MNPLTELDRLVEALLLDGLPVPDLPSQTGRTPKEVERLMQVVFTKRGVTSRQELRDLERRRQAELLAAARPSVDEGATP